MQNSAHHPRALAAESALGVTDPPELQCLRRRRFAAQPHHGSTGDQECSRDGTDLGWTPHSRLPVLAFPPSKRQGATATLDCTVPDSAAQRQGNHAKTQQCHNPAACHSRSPGHTHHALLRMYPGVPLLRSRQPGRKPSNNSPPFGYLELKYGGKGATVHYPCPSLVSSGE